MRLRSTLCQMLFSALIVIELSCRLACGQALQPIPTRTNETRQTAEQDKLPYKLTSRFHLQKGTNRGYVVLRVELEEGSYIYSLNQTGDVRPTRIRTFESKLFRLTGKFNSDRPATVIENDPMFKHRIEKHKGVIQFFAPIEVVPGLDVNQLTADLAFDGQVCQEAGYCMPILGLKVKCRFSGYFDPIARKRESSQSTPRSADRGQLRR